MWTYLQAWGGAASVLGVQLEGKHSISVTPEIAVEPAMVIKGFGARKGTMVFEQADDVWNHREAVLATGYTYSSFGPYREGETCSVPELLEVLGDWGWCGEGPPPRWLIDLDASNWTTEFDFIETLLASLEAPPWHGRSFNALRDSIVTGDINGLEPPFVIRIYNIGKLPEAALTLVRDVQSLCEIATNAGRPALMLVWP